MLGYILARSAVWVSGCNNCSTLGNCSWLIFFLAKVLVINNLPIAQALLLQYYIYLKPLVCLHLITCYNVCQGYLKCPAFFGSFACACPQKLTYMSGKMQFSAWPARAVSQNMVSSSVQSQQQ